ncbi:MAG: hypothetical protein IJK56_02535 [Firmicutes bacterium]|nr:hypothetical protein [Bacillota bacterium]
MLPTIKIGTLEVTRLIIGGNPFSGNSHVNSELSEAMRDYYTTARIKETLHRCEEFGINTMQLRGDAHIMRMIREFRAEGGKLNWIAQTAPEFLSFERNVREIVQAGANAIYHHGSTTDYLFKAGEYDELHRRLILLRETGLPVGLTTHMPEVIAYSEEHGWDVDFYMGCVYNISNTDRTSGTLSSVGGSMEAFYEEDIPLMYDRIRKTNKPCLAFKILGATRRCQSQETVRAAFQEAYREIKSTDGVVVGMYPKDIDQVKLNTAYAEEAIRLAAK